MLTAILTTCGIVLGSALVLGYQEVRYRLDKKRRREEILRKFAPPKRTL